MKRLLPFLVVCASAEAHHIPGLDQFIDLPSSLQIHGFASQNYIHTSANNFFGNSQNMGSLDFTESGINAFWTPLSFLDVAGQIVYRRAGNTDEQQVRIDYAMVNLHSTISYDHTQQTFGLRLGRVLNPYGFYNETRDMPFTRPSILLPQSIYFDINRNFALSSDGGQIYSTMFTDYGDLAFQFNLGIPRVDDPVWQPVLGTTREPNAHLSWVARLMYEYGQDTLRLAVSTTEHHIDFYNGGEHHLLFRPVLFSAQINRYGFSFTSEYAIRPSTFDEQFTTIGESYYFQLAYNVSESLQPYIRYDAYYNDRTDKDGKECYCQNPFDLYSKDITMGVRYDLNPNIMFRVEYHKVNGTGWLSPTENRPQDLVPDWNMIIGSVSFRF
jgi:hypothetical protein